MMLPQHLLIGQIQILPFKTHLLELLNPLVSQINLIRGDATSEFDIHLVKPFGKLGEPYVLQSYYKV
jgi:hypothetical protein